MKKPIVFEVNIGVKHFGILGSIFFVLAVLFVLILYGLFDATAMCLGVFIFIMGGFSGRAFEKRNKEVKGETGRYVSNRLPEKMG